jgi:hypothetical protein
LIRALRTLRGAGAVACLTIGALLPGAGPATASPLTAAAEPAAPKVTLKAPASPSSDTTPSFTGTASGTTPVTVQIFAGTKAKGTVVASATAASDGGAWASDDASPALSNGQFSAIATEANALPGGPAGKSKAVTFTVGSRTAPTPEPSPEPEPEPAPVPETVPPPAPPQAAFKWFPPVPVTREAVSLVSISTDPASPITGIEWALTSTDPFQPGEADLTTSFSTPGAHVVRLRVTNAGGVASIATETIEVLSPTARLMQPFPVVQIAGTEMAFGVKLGELKVQQLQAGALVTVRCKGRLCPIRLARRLAVSSRGRVGPAEFRGFERYLHSGVTLEILVSKPGEIGKYTRLSIRRGRLPERVDMCLDPTGVRPMRCPS